MRSLLLPPTKRISHPAMRPPSPLLAAVFAACVLALTVDAHAGAKARAPVIAGHPIPALVLTVPIHLGRQHAGMPIMPEMTVLPNRFVPVREDAEGIYYQAVAQFMPGSATNTGGLYLNKKNPKTVWAYVGDGRGADFNVGSSANVGRRHQDVIPDLALPLPPDCVEKLKIARPEK
jgi:hypothetical protein